MTNERKLQILREQEENAFESLPSLAPDTPEYGHCLNAIFGLGRLMQIIEDAMGAEKLKIFDYHLTGGGEAVEQNEPDPADPAEAETNKAPWDEPSATNEAPETETETETATKPEPEVTLTKDEVRAALTVIANEHGSEVIAATMQSMGYAKLSEVPAARYAELLSKAKEAV